jgi:hypothetical protein
MILKNQTQIAHPKVYQRNLHCDGLKSRWNPQANIPIGAGNNTSLQQAQMVYFSRRFVKNHQFGWSNLILVAKSLMLLENSQSLLFVDQYSSSIPENS